MHKFTNIGICLIYTGLSCKYAIYKKIYIICTKALCRLVLIFAGKEKQ